MTSIEKINIELAKKKMSGAELERRLGVSRSVYSQWNTGKTKPSRKRLGQIAEILDVPVENILADEDSNTYDVGAVATNVVVTDNDIKFALFGETDITDELYAEVKRYAKYAQEQEKFKKFKEKGE